MMRPLSTFPRVLRSLWLMALCATLPLLAMFAGASVAASEPSEEPDENTPPTVSVSGFDLDGPGGELTRLSGTASDRETPQFELAVRWTQTGGTPVQINRADQFTAHFMAPEVTQDQTFSFRMTATDAGGLSDSADVELTIFVADRVPDQFELPDTDFALPGDWVHTDPFTISGLNAPAPLTISAPDGVTPYLYINGDDAPDAELVRNGDVLEIDARAAATRGETVTVTIDIGGVSADWRITTLAIAGPIDAWSSADFPPPAKGWLAAFDQSARWDLGGFRERFSGRTLKVGDTASFWINNPRTRKSFRLAAISDHAYWWVDRSLRVDDAQLKSAVQRTELEVVPRVTAMFGDLPTVGGRMRKVHILNTEWTGELGGYVSSRDRFPDSRVQYSNETQVLYMNLRLRPLDQERYLATIAHELTHILQGHLDLGEATWLDEGLAELAEIVAGYPRHTIQGFYHYLTAPGNPPDRLESGLTWQRVHIRRCGTVRTVSI